MKIIIAGSRDIDDFETIREAVLAAGFKCRSQITEIVSGTARGVDQTGEAFANHHGLPIKRFPANWDRYGKSAGYRRNAEMAKYADFLVAVWDGKSRGTKHMIDLMRKEGKPVHVHTVNK